MLYQLHWQFIREGKTDGYFRTEMKSQKEINSKEEMTTWWNDVNERFPLPDGVCWLNCSESSEYFVVAVNE